MASAGGHWMKGRGFRAQTVGEMAKVSGSGGRKLSSTERRNADVQRWMNILDKNIHGPHHGTAKERLSAYLGSITLGRNFGEDLDSYIDRTGKRVFWNWASRQVR